MRIKNNVWNDFCKFVNDQQDVIKDNGENYE